ncbi:MAG: MBL fold metallo-hydrolase [Bacteroidales bacterium]|nr:MBL fold metallo-hydrolase [Bacteroidales bacterium]
MKHTIILLAAIILMATSCRNGNTQAQTTDTPHDPVITITTKDGVSLLIKDNQPLIFGLVDKENEMPKELFLGSYNDTLLTSLMPTGASRSAINAFIAVDSLNTILFDAGLGADNGGHLLEKMKNAEFDPAKVTAVCLTHLHFDHIGGLLLNGHAAFPNATLYLSQEEYDAWSDGGPLAKNNGMWKKVMEAYRGHIKTIHDGEELFNGMVVAKLAPGHTPGHTVYEVAGICLIAGDLLHAQDLQLDHPQFCARYDTDPAQAVATRTRIFKSVRENGQYLAGAHCYEHFINLRDRSKKQ